MYENSNYNSLKEEVITYIVSLIFTGIIMYGLWLWFPGVFWFLFPALIATIISQVFGVSFIVGLIIYAIVAILVLSIN
jgi:hypothetical protein